MIQVGFTKLKADYGVCVQSSTSSIIPICPYIDDLLIISSKLANIEKFKSFMMTEFEMIDIFRSIVIFRIRSSQHSNMNHDEP